MNLDLFVARCVSRSTRVGFVCVLAVGASGCMDGSMKEPPSEVRTNGALAANRGGASRPEQADQTKKPSLWSARSEPVGFAAGLSSLART